MGDTKPDDESPALVAEATVARRIRFERENRDWSPAKLAQQMTAAGYPLNQSAIWRIENGDPPRRVNLEEAVGFAKVFEMGLEDLITPVGAMATPELRRRLRNVLEATRAYQEAEAAAYRAVEALADYADSRPEQADVIKDISLSVLLSPDEPHLTEDVPESFLEDFSLYDESTRKLAFAFRARHHIGMRPGETLDPNADS